MKTFVTLTLLSLSILFVACSKKQLVQHKPNIYKAQATHFDHLFSIDSLVKINLFEEADSLFYIQEKNALDYQNYSLYFKLWVKHLAIQKKIDPEFPSFILNEIDSMLVNDTFNTAFFYRMKAEILKEYRKSNRLNFPNDAYLTQLKPSFKNNLGILDSLLVASYRGAFYVAENLKNRWVQTDALFWNHHHGVFWDNWYQLHLFDLLQSLQQIQKPFLFDSLLIGLAPSDFVVLNPDSLLMNHDESEHSIYHQLTSLKLAVTHALEKNLFENNNMEGLFLVFYIRLGFNGFFYPEQKVLKNVENLFQTHKHTYEYAIPLLIWAKALIDNDNPDLGYTQKVLFELKEYIYTYPFSKFTPSVNYLIAKTEQKFLNFELFQIQNESTPIGFVLNAKNTKTVFLKVYKLPIKTNFYAYGKDFLEFMNKNQAVFDTLIQLPSSHVYYKKQYAAFLPPLANGNYLVIGSDSKDFEESPLTFHQQFSVDKYQIVYVNQYIDPNKQLFRLLSSIDGSPISNTKLNIAYKNRYYWAPKKSQRTNSNGEFFIHKPKRFRLYNTDRWRYYRENKLKINIKSNAQSTIILNAPSGWKYTDKYLIDFSAYRSRKSYDLEKISLLADKILYKNDQEIQLKGVAYKFGKHKSKLKTNSLDELETNAENGFYYGQRVVKNKKYVVQLIKKYGYEVIDTFHVITNEFGSFSLKIPLNKYQLIHGDYYISIGNNSLNFKVDAYKLPRFKVDFELLQSLPKVGDSLKIKVYNTYFSGASSGNSIMNYKVKASFRNSNPQSNEFYFREEYELNKTDSMSLEGIGYIDLLADLPANYSKLNFPYDVKFDITASVVSNTGEQQEGTYTCIIPFAGKTQELIVPMSNLFVNQTLPIQIMHYNANEEPLPVNGKLEIYKLKSPPKSLLTSNSLYPYLGKVALFDTVAFSNVYPHFALPNQSIDLDDFEIDSMLHSLSIATLKTDSFGFWYNEFAPIKQGLYAIKSIFTTAFNDTIYESEQIKYITVFDTNQLNTFKGIHLELFERNNQSVFEADDTLHIVIQSGFDSLQYVQLLVASPNGVEINKLIKLSNGFSNVPIVIDSKWGKGKGKVLVQSFFNSIHLNKEFIFNIKQDIPKEIQYKWIRVSKFAAPAENISWEIQFSFNQKPINQHAEFLAVISDNALENLKPNKWSFYKYTPIDRNPYASYINVKKSKYSFSNNLFYHSNQSKITPQKFLIPVYFVSYEVDFMRSYHKNIYDRNQLLNGFVDTKFDRISDMSALPVSFRGSRNDGTAYFIDGVRVIGSENQTLAAMEIRRLPNRNLAGIPSFTAGVDLANANENKLISITDNSFQHISHTYSGYVASVRKNFTEIALFEPHLKPDSLGKVTFSFKMPDALTSWKLRGLLHTKDMESVYVEHDFVAQKELMILNSFPRFLRAGDSIRLPVTISNISDTAVSVVLSLNCWNDDSGNELSLNLEKKYFTIQRGQSLPQFWTIVVPDSVENMRFRITVANQFIGDAEELVLPVMPKVHVFTETIPFFVKEQQSFKLDRIVYFNNKPVQFHESIENMPRLPVINEPPFTLYLKDDTSTTIVNPIIKRPGNLNLNLKDNPLYEIISSLPSLANFSYDCSEQLANKLFAYTLAHKLYARSDVKDRLLAIKHIVDTDSLSLKPQILNPWGAKLENETTTMLRVLELFDEDNIKTSQKFISKKLIDQQDKNGLWPWFNKMNPSVEMTKEVMYTFYMMKEMNALGTKELSAITHLIRLLEKNILREESMDSIFSTNQQLYLMACGLFGISHTFTNHLLPVLINNVEQHGHKLPYTDKALLSIAVHKLSPDSEFPKINVKVFKQYSFGRSHVESQQYDSRMPDRGWSHEVEVQAMLLRAIAVIEPSNENIIGKSIQLLNWCQQYQWPSTKAAAKALFEIYMTLERNGFTDKRSFQVFLNNKEVVMPSSNWDGSMTFQLDDLQPETLKIQVNSGVVWGGLTQQYSAEIASYDFFNNPHFELKRTYFEVSYQNEKEVLTKINDKSAIKVGAKVREVVEVKVNKPTQFAHIHLQKPSFLEPYNQESGLKYANNLSYYLHIDDTYIDMFVEFLNKGFYLYTLDYTVAQKGVCNSGIGFLQQLYFPENITYLHSASLQSSD